MRLHHIEEPRLSPPDTVGGVVLRIAVDALFCADVCDCGRLFAFFLFQEVERNFIILEPRPICKQWIQADAVFSERRALSLSLSLPGAKFDDYPPIIPS